MDLDESVDHGLGVMVPAKSKKGNVGDTTRTGEMFLDVD